MQGHLNAVLAERGPGSAFSMTLPSDLASDAQLFIASLPDLLACPAGRAPIKLPTLPVLADAQHSVARAALRDSAIEADVGEEADPGLIVEHVGMPAPPVEHVPVHMRVVHCGGGSMKVPPISPAHGRRLRAGEIVVSIHPVMLDSAAQVSVLSRAQRVGESPLHSAG
eukprot:13765936-Alexandrium_andersonii.AAC.1